MTEFSFACTGVRADRYAAGPTLVFRLRVTAADNARVHALALRCQIRIEPARRGYEPAEADALRHMIRAQISAWRAAVTERRAVADRHRAALDAGTAQIERIAQVSYDAGERGILELLDAYRTGSAARIRQAELDAAVREAEIELEFVSGWEIP